MCPRPGTAPGAHTESGLPEEPWEWLGTVKPLAVWTSQRQGHCVSGLEPRQQHLPLRAGFHNTAGLRSNTESTEFALVNSYGNMIVIWVSKNDLNL